MKGAIEIEIKHENVTNENEFCLRIEMKRKIDLLI